MKFNIEKIFERDIDLLVINKFMNDKTFKNYFLSKINLYDYNIIEVYHSFSDNNGEADIVIVLENGFEKICLLIKNKINAIAMPEQYNRYVKRGKKGLDNKLYDRFFIFIIAPKDYLKSNSEAKKYDNKISYEELIECIKDNDIYGKNLLESAINIKKKGYSVIKNESITQFWDKYYRLIDEKYPFINIKKYNGPRGSNAVWPGFYTPVKGIMIQHKSNKGYMDLTFKGLASKYYEVLEIVSDKLDDDMSLEVATNSLVIRIHVPIIDFEMEFDDYLNELDVCFNAANRLEKLLYKIDYNKILELNNK